MLHINFKGFTTDF